MQTQNTNGEPEIEYEEPPKVTPLRGDDYAPDAATLAAACWLLRRYSSYTYIFRAHELLCAIADAYEVWPGNKGLYSDATRRAYGRSLRDRTSSLSLALPALRRGGRSHSARRLILEALDELEPPDPRDELHFSLGLLQDELGADAALCIRRVKAMASRVARTLRGEWSFESLQPPRLSLPAMRLPDAKAPTVRTGERVPTTGIWLPTHIRSGCPNVLVGLNAAPPLTRAVERIDYPAVTASGDDEARAAFSDWEYASQDTTWRLLWADDRYSAKGAGDEPDYLAEDNALPAAVKPRDPPARGFFSRLLGG